MHKEVVSVLHYEISNDNLNNMNFSWLQKCFHLFETSSLPLKCSIFLPLYSALVVIEQWGFSSVPHLLEYGSSVYNGHLWGLVILTPVAEQLAVVPVLRRRSVATGIRTPNFPHARRTFWSTAPPPRKVILNSTV